MSQEKTEENPQRSEKTRRALGHGMQRKRVFGEEGDVNSQVITFAYR